MEIFLPVIGVSFAAWCVWAVVRVVNEPRRWGWYLRSVGLIAGLCLVGALFLPAFRRAGPVARRSQCKNNLKQIALALHNYHDAFGCLPPAYIADASGKPLHSWRVLLLPYLDHKPLYDLYRFDEPWDGPNNRKLADKIVSVYNCPGEHRPAAHSTQTSTSYVAIIGPETLWRGDRSTKFDDIKDGTSNTLMIVEVVNSGIHWMEPRDLHVLQMAPTINAKSGQGISSPHTGGAYAMLVDGSVRFVNDQITAETIRGLLTVNGGETIGDY